MGALLTFVTTMTILVFILYSTKIVHQLIVSSSLFETKYEGPKPDNYVEHGLLDYVKWLVIIGICGLIISFYI